jgi:hypothetical protein
LAPFGQAISEEKIFLTLANQKKKLILVAMFVGRMEQSFPLKQLGQMEPNLAVSIYRVCKVLYKVSPFRSVKSVPPTNMAAKQPS